MLLATILLPVALSLGQRLVRRASPRLEQRLLAHLVYPPLWGARRAVPLPSHLGYMPTRGQAGLIAVLALLNAILSVANYHGTLPSLLYSSPRDRFWKLLALRSAVLAFANMPPLVLFSMRNNPLLRLTGWPYSTFLLFHRWVAYMCVGHAVAHGAIYTLQHWGTLFHKFTQTYWLIGNVTALVMLLMLPLSLLWFRRRWYEVFVDVHGTLALFTLAGCYLHVYTKYGHELGYSNWIALSLILWPVEKICRIYKIATSGYHMARVQIICEDYIQVTIPRLEKAGYAHLYFLSATGWRVWENHPFSIASSITTTPEGGRGKAGAATISEPDLSELALEAASDTSTDASTEEAGEWGDRDAASNRNWAADRRWAKPRRWRASARDLAPPAPPLSPASGSAAVPLLGQAGATRCEEDEFEMAPVPGVARPPWSGVGASGSRGAAFFIRREQGATRRLYDWAAAAPSMATTVPVLVEAPYRSALDYGLRGLAVSAAPVVCIVGGAGVSAVLPLVRARAAAAPVGGRRRATALYWSTQSAGLVHAVRAQNASLFPGNGSDSHAHDRPREDEDGDATAAGDDRGEEALVDFHVRVTPGQPRWAVTRLLRTETDRHAATHAGPTTVIVCGPPAMADAVRAAVVSVNRRRLRRGDLAPSGAVRLVEESFTW